MLRPLRRFKPSEHVWKTLVDVIDVKRRDLHASRLRPLRGPGTQSAYGVFLTMWRFGSGAPSCHQMGPRSPNARLALSTAACASFSASASSRARGSDISSRGHEIGHQLGLSRFRQLRVSEPPKTSANDEISSVRCDRMLQRHAPSLLAGAHRAAAPETLMGRRRSRPAQSACQIDKLWTEAVFVELKKSESDRQLEATAASASGVQIKDVIHDFDLWYV